ncbi:hypothetical protein RFI_18245, partial [Reticulomyxa filosa]
QTAKQCQRDKVDFDSSIAEAEAKTGGVSDHHYEDTKVQPTPAINQRLGESTFMIDQPDMIGHESSSSDGDEEHNENPSGVVLLAPRPAPMVQPTELGIETQHGLHVNSDSIPALQQMSSVVSVQSTGQSNNNDGFRGPAKIELQNVVKKETQILRSGEPAASKNAKKNQLLSELSPELSHKFETLMHELVKKTSKTKHGAKVMQIARDVTERRNYILFHLYPLPRCWYYCGYLLFVLFSIICSVIIIVYGSQMDLQPSTQIDGHIQSTQGCTYL